MAKSRSLSKMRKHTHPALIVFFVFFSFICLYPFWYVLVLSFNDATDAYRGGIYFWPRVWSLASYAKVFKNEYILNSFFISFARCVLMMVLVPLFGSMYAYAITRRELFARKFFRYFLVVPMYFGGGIIPFYILLKNLGLLDTFWVYIIPYCSGAGTVLLFRSYFQANSETLREAALIDGANEFQVFFRIVFPTAIPVFAAQVLFVAVGQWNEWSIAQLFVSNPDLLPNATLLMQIMNSVRSDIAGNMTLAEMMEGFSQVSVASMRYAMIVVSTVPILLIYPLLQKYFMHGIMIGAVKE